MEESYFKKYFDGLFSLKKFPINFFGGFALGAILSVYPMFEKKIDIFQPDKLNFIIGFVWGYIHMNFVVKEVRIITFNDALKFMLPIGGGLVLILTLLGL